MALEGMRLLTAALFLISVPALAKPKADPCFQLLSNPKAVASVVTDSQRRNVGSLALSTMKPPSESNVHQLNPQPEIEQLSKLNLERLSGKLRERMGVEKETNAALDAALEKIDFAALRRFDGQIADNPVLTPDVDFYANLTKNNRTVAFRLTAFTANRLDASAALLGADFARLEDKFADAQGFVLPHFDSAEEISRFFAEWDPQILERQIRSNNFNLPAGLDSVPQFLNFLGFDEASSVFSDPELYTRLGVLRQQLHRYLLTPQDARQFALLVLKLHILKAAREGSTFELQFHELHFNPIKLFSQALAAIGWPGMDLRVPLAISSGKISIIRYSRPLLPVSSKKYWDRDERSEYPVPTY
jgi:hypothetical protein